MACGVAVALGRDRVGAVEFGRGGSETALPALAPAALGGPLLIHPGASQPRRLCSAERAPRHALDGAVVAVGRENRGYDLAVFEEGSCRDGRRIMAASNKELKQTSACPSFARAPGAAGALALAA